MSLLKNYSISCDENFNYTISFETTEKAVVFPALLNTNDGSLIKIKLNKNRATGTLQHSHFFTSINNNKNFNFEFDQPNSLESEDLVQPSFRKPSGSIIGG
jgi:hypothetical protein